VERFVPVSIGSVRFVVFWFGAVSFVSKSNTVIFLKGEGYGN